MQLFSGSGAAVKIVTLRAIMDTVGIATAGQNYGAVKIMTLHHNFDWRQMRKKRAENGSFKVQVENKSFHFVRATTERSVPHPT